MAHEEFEQDLTKYLLPDLLEVFNIPHSQNLRWDELIQRTDSVIENIETEDECDDDDDNTYKSLMVKFLKEAKLRLFELLKEENEPLTSIIGVENEISTNDKREICTYVTINSKFRDDMNHPTDSFTSFMAERLRGVYSMSLFCAEIPLTWNTIDERKGNNFFYIGIIAHNNVSIGIKNTTVLDNKVYLSRENYIRDKTNRLNNCGNVTVRNEYDENITFEQMTTGQVMWKKIIIPDGNYTNEELATFAQQAIDNTFKDVFEDGVNLSGLIKVTYDSTRRRIKFSQSLSYETYKYAIIIRMFDSYGYPFLNTTQNTNFGYIMGFRGEYLMDYIFIYENTYKNGNDGDIRDLEQDTNAISGTTIPDTTGTNAIYIGVDDNVNESSNGHIGTTFRDKILDMPSYSKSCFLKEYLKKRTIARSRTVSTDDSTYNFTFDEINIDQIPESGITPQQLESLQIKLDEKEGVKPISRYEGNLDNVCGDCGIMHRDDSSKVLARISIPVPPVMVKEDATVRYRIYSGENEGLFQRTYNGPVTLSKLHIYVKDENGCRVGLNDHDMSVTLKLCRRI